MNHSEAMMRQALDLFVKDPPDNDFQRGYLSALMVFANEGMGFRWNDPALTRCENMLSGKPSPPPKPKLTIV